MLEQEQEQEQGTIYYRAFSLVANMNDYSYFSYKLTHFEKCSIFRQVFKNYTKTTFCTFLFFFIKVLDKWQKIGYNKS